MKVEMSFLAAPGFFPIIVVQHQGLAEHEYAWIHKSAWKGESIQLSTVQKIIFFVLRFGGVDFWFVLLTAIPLKLAGKPIRCLSTMVIKWLASSDIARAQTRLLQLESRLHVLQQIEKHQENAIDFLDEAQKFEAAEALWEMDLARQLSDLLLAQLDNIQETDVEKKWDQRTIDKNSRLRTRYKSALEGLDVQRFMRQQEIDLSWELCVRYGQARAKLLGEEHVRAGKISRPLFERALAFIEEGRTIVRETEIFVKSLATTQVELKEETKRQLSLLEHQMSCATKGLLNGTLHIEDLRMPR